MHIQDPYVATMLCMQMPRLFHTLLATQLLSANLQMKKKEKRKKRYQNLTPDLKLVELVWSVRRCRFFLNFIYHLHFVSFCFMFILFFLIIFRFLLIQLLF